MDTAVPQKLPFILDRNLTKANCTGNRVCTSCDIVVLGFCSNKMDYIRQKFLYISDSVVHDTKQFINELSKSEKHISRIIE